MPVHRILTHAVLEKALVDIDDLPAGYSEDPPSEDGENKNFCDYKAPVTERIRVGRDFTKGGGMSAELVRVTLRQFKSAAAASAAWKAMTDTLKTCKSETYDGTRLTYSKMSAPKVGDASVGVRIEADGVTLLQNFVLAGPVLISTGGGGLMNADADTVTGVLKAQVRRYVEASTS